MTRRAVDGRAVALFVVLDLVTYALLYWLVVPAFEPVLAALGTVMAVAIGHVLTAVRLTFLGAVTVRSIRSRRGLTERSEVVPTMVVAALAGWGTQFVLGILAMLYLGDSPWHWAMVLSLVEWVAFALLGAMFVAPGDPDAAVPRRYRAMADRESGAVSLFLVPAIAGLVAVTVLVIVVMGSATNDRREASTAGDAAALAAGIAWRDALEDRFNGAGTDSAAFWTLAGSSIWSSSIEAAMRSSAAQYAARNDAELLEMNAYPSTGRVWVRVRSLQTVPESSDRMESTATSELQFRSGLCRHGAELGYLIGGVCVGSEPPAPTPTATPTAAPTPDPTPTPTPFEDPTGGFKIDVVLTAS